MTTNPFAVRRLLWVTAMVVTISGTAGHAGQRNDVHVVMRIATPDQSSHTEPDGNWVLAEARVFADGDAVGTVHLRLFDGTTFIYRVLSGSATVEGQIVSGLTLTLERVGAWGQSTGDTDTLIVRRDPVDAECLIYQAG